jgi:hypothetical protein
VAAQFKAIKLPVVTIQEFVNILLFVDTNSSSGNDSKSKTATFSDTSRSSRHRSNDANHHVNFGSDQIVPTGKKTVFFSV